MKSDNHFKRKKFWRNSVVAIVSIIAAFVLFNVAIALMVRQTDMTINLAIGGAEHVVGMAVVAGLFAVLLDRVLLRPKKEPNIMGMLGRYLIHYLLVFGVVQLYWWVVVGVHARSWVELAWMLGGFTGVYVISFGVEYLIDLRTARQLNKRIKNANKKTP